jgi:hypothetical protein
MGCFRWTSACLPACVLRLRLRIKFHVCGRLWPGKGLKRHFLHDQEITCVLRTHSTAGVWRSTAALYVQNKALAPPFSSLQYR